MSSSRVWWSWIALALAVGTACEEPFRPPFGDMALAVATNGPDPDTDGYVVLLNGDSSGVIAPNGTMTLAALDAGDHSIALAGMDANCSVFGAHPRLVRVYRDSAVAVAFIVNCRARTGSVRLAVTTTGADLDPDGYRVTFGAGTSYPFPRNGVFMIPGILIGTHAVAVDGIAPNCTADVSPDSVLVAWDSTSDLALSVACSATTGTIAITTTTGGANLDGNGYQVRVDGGPQRAIAATGTLSLPRLPAGLHTVVLGDVAANCTVAPADSVDVNLAAGDTVHIAFDVTCYPPAMLRVVTATSGADQDVDGYGVVVDSGPPSAIGLNDSVEVATLAGVHTVALRDVAGNCSVTPPNPDTVTVGFGDTVRVAFDVTCFPPTILRVVTATTGTEQDVDGYGVVVDSGPSSPIGLNDSVEVLTLAGVHTVELRDVAGNCSVTPPNPDTVTVAFGDTARIAFAVDCVSTTGMLVVRTATTGRDLDPDGYLVGVDPYCDYYYGYICDYRWKASVGLSDSVAFVLPVGNHTVVLDGVASNCVTSSAVIVAVHPAATDSTTFAVTCHGRGAIAVTLATTGVDLDPDGYSVTVARPGYIVTSGTPINGTALFPDLLATDYTVTVANTSLNCDVTPPNPRPLTVLEGDTAATTFTVVCAAAAELAFTRTDGGNTDIYRMRSNGTGLARLTTASAIDAAAAWSPDGSRIAFVSDRDGNQEIYVMNADGTGQTRLTSHTARDYAPAWSPDGAKIVFVSERDGNAEIYVMDAAGTNPLRLTSHGAIDTDPAWSPGGATIAFTSNRGVTRDIWVMNADGTMPTRLTNTGAPNLHPDWSPDGARIVFATLTGCGYYACDYDLVVMNADGSGAVGLPSSQIDTDPAWSFDGVWIAYTAQWCDDYYGCFLPAIHVRRVGGGPERFAVSNASQPAWRP